MKIAPLEARGGGMFGIGNDQNQNSAAGVPPVPPAAAPVGQNLTAPSAPTLADPTAPLSSPSVTGVPPVADINIGDSYTAPAPQVGPSKASEPGALPGGGPIINNSSAPPPTADNDLAQIKQQALQSLEPIVGHLDQEPEEKFKTLMMLIQASDNSGLLKEAHDAAGKIKDEKTRAQALLDVVNEVNYFAHKAQSQ